MKNWSQLTYKGKIRRLNMLYNFIERNEEINEMYKELSTTDNKYLVEDLRELILKNTNNQIRVQNLSTKDLLEW